MFQKFLSDVTVMYWQKYYNFWADMLYSHPEVDYQDFKHHIAWCAWKNMAMLYQLLYGQQYYELLCTRR